MENMNHAQIDPRTKEALDEAFAAAENIVFKKYLEQLADCPVAEIPDWISEIDLGANICLYHIDKIVYDKKENIQDKLTTVYATTQASSQNSLFMLLDSHQHAIDLYLGIAHRQVENGTVPPKVLTDIGKTLADVFVGNFPGSQIHRVNIEAFEKEETVKSVLKRNISNASVVAAVSGIPALRNQDEHDSEEFVQGMEKLIDSMRGKEYAMLFLADARSNLEIEETCAGYEELYSRLSPFKMSVQTINASTSKGTTYSLIEGVTETVSKSTAKTVSTGKTNGTNTAETLGGSVYGGVHAGGVNAGMAINASETEGKTNSKTKTRGRTRTRGKSTATSEQKSVADAVTTMYGDGLQITYESRAIKSLMERIDEQIKRMRSCEDFGMFDCCVYVLAPKYETAVAAASIYKSLMRGENSSAEASIVNIWTDKEKVKKLRTYLARCYHPLFQVHHSNTVSNFTQPSLLISGKELAIQFALPKKSVAGLPVIQCAEFGRNVMAVHGDYEGDLLLGSIYHMHQNDENTLVALRSKDLTAHTFITGSTGAGKSRTIYKILEEACFSSQQPAKFLVVEPAKGEYKNIFGGYDGVSVFGTNLQKTPLLRLNPFSFPEDIHVLEHIDRLIEIFNASWPMYAAMPAVLKDAIEAAYISCGWNLTRSVCTPRQYPTFATVLKKLPEIMDSSLYSSDTKSDYSGALITRIKSLTNGIYGQIFCAEEEVSNQQLFDENVIIDLSRIGSMETKSLLMGILMIKLQEYRMAQGGMDSALKHITVLEEAHNLLRRTSGEQSQESSNLQGKSVEMLANAIAEMRTYGEGFIIADQAPGLLDMAVIRNTNTKIIMRLPDQSDRELVGKAVGLNEEQITELAKLDVGVAAVFQNSWLAPVLCKVDYFSEDKPFVYHGTSENKTSPLTTMLFNKVLHGVNDGKELSQEEVDRIKLWIDRVDTGRTAKMLLLKVVEQKEPLTEDERCYLCYCLVKGNTLVKQWEQETNREMVQKSIDIQIADQLQISEALAEEIRKNVFVYVATHIDQKNIEYRNELLYYGGVR